MMYPFLTLADETEIVHSEYLPDNTVKVYVEKPDDEDCFHHMTCILPSLTVVENFGFSKNEIDNYMEIIESSLPTIIEFSKEGGFENASSF